MAEGNIFDGFPVIEKRTAPTVAKVVFEAKNIEFLEIPGWEGRTDEALVRTHMPESGVLRETPDDNSPEFHTKRLPSQGRADTVLLAKPAIIDGKKCGALIRKGVGAEPAKINEQGDVFGTPKKGEDRTKATYGFAVLQQCIEEKDISEVWVESGLRIRKTVKVYDLQEILMMKGASSTHEMPYEEAKLAGEVIYAVRNPITFEDAIEFFRKASTQEEQKIVADRLLSVCGKFLKMTDDADNNAELVALLENNDAKAEREWFRFLATGYGKQMMTKTERGLYHSEMHRQNNYLGVENGDFADHGSPGEQQTPYDLGSYQDAKLKRKHMLLIREGSEVLTQIVDLKVNFNLANERPWDDGIGDLVEDYLDGMRSVDSQNVDEVITKTMGDFYRMSLSGKAPTAFWGVSDLTFINDKGVYDDKKIPVRSGTPGKRAVLSLKIAEEIDEHCEKLLYPEQTINRLLSYQTMYVEDEVYEFIEEYLSVINDPSFSTNLSKYFEGIVSMLESGPINPNLVFDYTVEGGVISTSFSGDGMLFMIESGLMKEVGNIIALPPSERRNYVQSHNFVPKNYDVESIRNYVNSLE